MGAKSAAVAFPKTRGAGHDAAGRVELGLDVLTIPEVDEDTLTVRTALAKLGT